MCVCVCVSKKKKVFGNVFFFYSFSPCCLDVECYLAQFKVCDERDLYQFSVRYVSIDVTYQKHQFDARETENQKKKYTHNSGIVLVYG